MGTRKLTVALVPLLALSLGCAEGGDGDAMSEDTAMQEGQAALPASCLRLQGVAPTETPVEISLVDDQITVSDDLPKVRRQGGNLKLTSRELHFAIAPHAAEDGVAPLGQQLHAGQPGPPPLTLPVADPRAPCGTYKYSVAVWDGEKIVTLDPDYQLVP